MALSVLNSTLAKARKEVLNGRRYLVAAATLIVPGVLNGSQGALYYPPDEVLKDPEIWNAVPLVVDHPTVDGTPVSARHPAVLNDCGIGFIFNAKGTDGALVAEAWFDADALRRADAKLPPAQRILPRLERGLPIELSTGLRTRNDPAPAGAVYNGQPYDFIARDYGPDHVAVLPGKRGACSNADGCGVNVQNDGQPSDAIDPDKACEILKDGTVKGEPLTEAQRGMFGAACRQARSAALNQRAGRWPPEKRLAALLVINAFCATGEGGGVDPSCPPGVKEAADARAAQKEAREKHAAATAKLREKFEDAKANRDKALAAHDEIRDSVRSDHIDQITQPETDDPVHGAISKAHAALEEAMLDYEYANLTPKESVKTLGRIKKLNSKLAEKAKAAKPSEDPDKYNAGELADVAHHTGEIDKKLTAAIGHMRDAVKYHREARQIRDLATNLKTTVTLTRSPKWTARKRLVG